uniref:Exonuclease domain-containing protein n=1 Tax=Rhizophora mucronata TaxID=61149 RepID=A0A2P2J8F3_RHIMU
MRTVTMCLSMLQFPRFRIHTLANFWREGSYSIDRTCGNSSNFRLLASKSNALEGGYSKRFIRRPVSTKTEGRSKTTKRRECTDVRDENLGNKLSASTTLSANKIEANEFQKIQDCDIQQNIAENKDLAELMTVIVFDIETTGFSREYDQIIEIALQDLKGGEYSTFQSLVNPERFVPNSHVHGITTHMVCRPEVPRMGELIPILLQFIRSRQKPGGYVLLVAHNALAFDVPFLIKGFSRCSVNIPSNWLFLDTLPLAREVFKAEGSYPSIPSSVCIFARICLKLCMLTLQVV